MRTTSASLPHSLDFNVTVTVHSQDEKDPFHYTLDFPRLVASIVDSANVNTTESEPRVFFSTPSHSVGFHPDQTKRNRKQIRKRSGRTPTLDAGSKAAPAGDAKRENGEPPLKEECSLVMGSVPSAQEAQRRQSHRQEGKVGRRPLRRGFRKPSVLVAIWLDTLNAATDSELDTDDSGRSKATILGDTPRRVDSFELAGVNDRTRQEYDDGYSDLSRMSVAKTEDGITAPEGLSMKSEISLASPPDRGTVSGAAISTQEPTCESSKLVRNVPYDMSGFSEGESTLSALNGLPANSVLTYADVLAERPTTDHQERPPTAKQDVHPPTKGEHDPFDHLPKGGWTKVGSKRKSRKVPGGHAIESKYFMQRNCFAVLYSGLLVDVSSFLILVSLPI